jgi:hypothetical protein
MKRILPVIFIILGTLDTIYGAIRSDVISLVIGVVIVVISVYILRKEQANK